MNGISDLRTKVIEFMEDDIKLNKFKNDDWYAIEDSICKFVCQLLNINEKDKIFSNCDNVMSGDYPTLYEEKIYKKVDKHYHLLDIMACIEDDQSQREVENEPKLKYQAINIKELLNEYENNITGSENLQLARDILYEYQRCNILEEDTE